jgi:hypothetical protein
VALVARLREVPGPVLVTKNSHSTGTLTMCPLVPPGPVLILMNILSRILGTLCLFLVDQTLVGSGVSIECLPRSFIEIGAVPEALVRSYKLHIASDPFVDMPILLDLTPQTLDPELLHCLRWTQIWFRFHDPQERRPCHV